MNEKNELVDFFFSLLLGIESKTLHIGDKYFTTVLNYPAPSLGFTVRQSDAMGESLRSSLAEVMKPTVVFGSSMPQAPHQWEMMNKGQ